MFLKQYGKCLQHCELQRINQKHSKCSMQWKCSSCRNSSLSGFWVCVLCNLNIALSIVLLTITFTLLKIKCQGLLKCSRETAQGLHLDSPRRKSWGMNEFSPLCLILFIWRQALNKRKKADLTHIIIFSPSKAVLKILPNLFKAPVYGKNSILESDILEKRFPECTLSSLKGALLKVPTGYYYLLLREVD